jgi:hypothetical protein
MAPCEKPPSTRRDVGSGLPPPAIAHTCWMSSASDARA